ncbi:acyl-CoA dehydrogenase family protein [Hydrogenophaga palleronii]|uniref:acyl-CoA dehydrogenase family protein n=1 Tax=Hydrogenophaga palleronii TaxID=65655 RepID=UPI0014722F37|nr:acyl-CoA dehydrogenase family protein [Hydrogenophaga palleronii]
MPTNAVLSPSAPGPDLLHEVVDSGLLRCGVPPHLGGAGSDLDALAAGAAELARHHPGAAWLLWAQRLAIEALLQSPNVALREHWLADFLSGERAATLSPTFTPLQAHDTGRGWLLRGEQLAVPNLQWAGFSLVAPLRLHEQQAHWVLLRSEEDGLSIMRDTESPGHGDPPTATLQLNQVFFREDEWLCGPDLPQRLLPVAQALGRGLACATDWNPNTAPTLSP